MHVKRIGNREYAYRSKRIGGKVVSEYLGKADGDLALIARMLAAEDDAERLDAREQERQERDAEATRERKLDDLVADAIAEAAKYLESRGYHRPKRGVWRKRRCPTT